MSACEICSDPIDYCQGHSEKEWFIFNATEVADDILNDLADSEVKLSPWKPTKSKMLEAHIVDGETIVGMAFILFDEDTEHRLSVKLHGKPTVRCVDYGYGIEEVDQFTSV